MLLNVTIDFQDAFDHSWEWLYLAFAVDYDYMCSPKVKGLSMSSHCGKLCILELVI